MDTPITVLADIPFSLNQSDFLTSANITSDSGLEAEAISFLEWATPRIRPKAIHRIAFIDERNDDSVVIGGERFRSDVLSANLKDVERVFAFIATCGNEFEDTAYEVDPFLGPFWIDSLKSKALQSATAALQADLGDRYGLTDFTSMHPGSADVDVWPIAQQRELFALFGNVAELIGVNLTESYLMLPTKSVSGVYFETDATFISCQLCTREICPSRRAEYTGRLT